MSSTAENTPHTSSAPVETSALAEATRPPSASSEESLPGDPSDTQSAVTEDTTFIRYAVAAAADRKAEGILVLDVSKVSGFTDFFMICSGTNDRQVQAITESIVRRLRKHGLRPLHVEGRRPGNWVLIDFGGEMVIHVFLDETRHFYALERLWGDAPDITETILASLDELEPADEDGA